MTTETANETATANDATTAATKSKGGFGAMTAEQLKEMARLGGKAAHARGTAYVFNSETARAAAMKGVETRRAKRAAAEAAAKAQET